MNAVVPRSTDALTLGIEDLIEHAEAVEEPTVELESFSKMVIRTFTR
jgi:hypothetical protein